MNLIAECNCCACEAVCKYKSLYQNGAEAILNTMINDYNGGFFELKNCPHIEVSIKCPHMIPKSQQNIVLKKGVGCE